MDNASVDRKRLVVIGNGMAGVATVEALLSLYHSTASNELVPQITIFGNEPHPNYNRILLSEVLANRRPSESITLNSPQWYEEHHIDLRTDVHVTAIDPTRSCVTDSTGAKTPYDRLLIAVGATPFIPPIPGTGNEGVYVFRSIEDTRRITARARTSRNAVVIGGGLLGLEAARALVSYGTAVTVIHLMDRLMEQQLDAVGAAMLKREVERVGIEVRLKSTAAEICGNGSVEAIRLDSGQSASAGERLAADLVLICTGVRPDLTLARSAGLETRQGIVVDDQLQTSLPDIYAVGDVIEHRGRCYGLVAPLRDQAKVAARMIARDLSGWAHPTETSSYEGTLCATTLKVAGVNLTSAGQFLGGEGCEEFVWADTYAATYRKLVLKSNRLVGTILLGDIRDSARLFGLIRSGEDISSVKEQLMNIRSASGGRDGAQFSLSVMADTEIICHCHSVSKGALVSAIQANGIRHRDEVARYTKAGTGCGSCVQQVDDLLAEMTKHATATVPKRGTPLSPSTVDPLPMAKPLVGYPAVYPKSLDLERIKREGLGLDFDTIDAHGVMALTEDDYYRLKTYGVCSQKHPGYFMVRLRIPGGRLTDRQLMGVAELAETHGRGWAHLTTRQNIELHWVRLEEIPSIWKHLATIGLSTRSACGHTMRNVMACDHGGVSPSALIDAQPWANAISDYFLARSDLINPAMPNRLNIYVAGCPECEPHAVINDIGLVAVKNVAGVSPEQARSTIGFALWAGGSLGAHPMLGLKLTEWLEPDEVLPACQAIFEIHTKYGNRTKAKSRLKHLVAQWGAEKFSAVFHRVFERKRTLPENRSLRLPATETRAGRLETQPSTARQLRAALMGSCAGTVPDGCLPQRQRGYVRATVHVPLGEMRAGQLRAIAKIVRRHGNGEARFTKDQNVELPWIERLSVTRMVRALGRVGLVLEGQQPAMQVTACPGTEFCVLAVTNAQGAAKELLKNFRPKQAGAAALLRNVSIAVSGCPNSCTKHQVADIGLAGTITTVGDERRYSYVLYLGGRLDTTVRLGELVRKGITEAMVVPTIEALLEVVSGARQDGEWFQEVIDRVGPGRIGELLEHRVRHLTPHATAKIEMVPDLLEVAG